MVVYTIRGRLLQADVKTNWFVGTNETTGRRKLFARLIDFEKIPEIIRGNTRCMIRI